MSTVLKPTPPENIDLRLPPVWPALRRAFAPIIRLHAEILLTLAMLGGWALLTWGIALLTTWKVWPVSGGLLLLSCGGWRMLWTLASYGLYGLTREVKHGP